MKILRGIENGLRWFEKIFCMITLFVVLGAMLYQMFTRIFLQVASPGAEEVMRYVQIWMCWIGATYALSNGAWPGMDILDTLVDHNKNKDKILEFARLAELVVSAIFLGWFMYVYYSYFFGKIVNAPNYSSILHIHLKWIMGSITVATPLMLAHMIIKIFAGDWKAAAQAEDEEAGEELVLDAEAE